MVFRLSTFFAVCLLASTVVSGQEYSVQKLEEGPPQDAISEKIAAQLTPSGYTVKKGTNRTVCRLWLAKSWTGKPGFEPTFTVLYPFAPGEFIGVIEYPRRAGDFRDQQVEGGVYTIRYGQQPVDGNHVGTSDTLDFLLLLPADNDKDPKQLDMDTMIPLSAQVAGSTHPAILSMLRSNNKAEAPAVAHDEDRDLWSVRLAGEAKAGDEGNRQIIEFVVVGHAAE